MPAVRRKADTAAHYDAVHEGHIGFWELGDAGVEDVLLAPQDLAEIAFDFRALVERPDIAAGAKAALAGTLQHDHADGRVGFEPVKRLVDVAKHLQRHRVDRLRSVEPDNSRRAFAPCDQVGLLARNGGSLSRHRAPSINFRETISRMISLVPSRI